MHSYVLLKNIKSNKLICSISKHQLNTDLLNKNSTCIPNVVSVSLRQHSI